MLYPDLKLLKPKNRSFKNYDVGSIGKNYFSEFSMNFLNFQFFFDFFVRNNDKELNEIN